MIGFVVAPLKTFNKNIFPSPPPDVLTADEFLLFDLNTETKVKDFGANDDDDSDGDYVKINVRSFTQNTKGEKTTKDKSKDKSRDRMNSEGQSDAESEEEELESAERRRLHSKFLKFWSQKTEAAMEEYGAVIGDDAAAVESDAELRRFVSSTLTTCAICWENKQNVIFFCKHAACHECHVYLENCHICRRPIETKIRICK